MNRPQSGDANPDGLLAEARRMYARGEYGPVVRLCKDLLRTDPRNAPVLLTLGMAELAFDHFDESLAALNKAARLIPQEPKVHLAVAAAERRRGHFPEAHAAVDRALAARPGDAGALAAKATLLCMEGDYQRAADTVGDVVAAQPGCAELAPAQVFGRACVRLGQLAEGITAINQALERPGVSGDRAAALIQLGELLDAAGEFDRAFEAYEKAAAIRRQVSRYDPAAHSAAVDLAIGAWTAERVRSLPVSSVRGERLVFIVGMLRSGTTLVEQILASHPKVFGAGERLDVGRAAAALQPVSPGPLPMLTDLRSVTRAALDLRGRELMQATTRLNGTADRITDKNPLNFLHLGLIRQMLPGARVIHCIRDPKDTCLSCYFNVSASIAWANDLEHLGRFFRDYRRLMAHWRSALSDLPLLDVVYEDLVADPEGGARRIVEFAGLAWDPACARFHENRRVALTPSIDQVRRPMYTSSIGRWRVYKEHLGPLDQGLRGIH